MMSYINEDGFPTVPVLKSKYRVKINVEKETRGRCPIWEVVQCPIRAHIPLGSDWLFKSEIKILFFLLIVFFGYLFVRT